jgi:xanthine dehydrogenase accessory factor
MTPLAAELAAFVAGGDAVLVELVRVRGSSPRQEGTFMLVSQAALWGTIGGGQFEWLAIDHARDMLRSGRSSDRLEVPLGPDIGQCCGGHVVLDLKHVDHGVETELLLRLEAENASAPHVFVFGAGHVGRALVTALSPLPLQTHLVDTRPEHLQDLPETIAAYASAMPESLVRAAPEGSSFVVLTHDHALDFMIAAEALRRPDSPYVGMVGSKTKRARFAHWFRDGGGTERELERLVCPIGSQGLGDKRPVVIAALAAAEILVHIGAREADEKRVRPVPELTGADDGC